jgi:hypothetical protein
MLCIRGKLLCNEDPKASVYVSIRQHMAAYVSTCDEDPEAFFRQQRVTRALRICEQMDVEEEVRGCRGLLVYTCVCVRVSVCVCVYIYIYVYICVCM